MKVTDNRSRITFGELKTGDIFCDGDGEILMKITPYYSDLTNCVNLRSGQGYSFRFDEGDEVTLITNAVLIIN